MITIIDYGIGNIGSIKNMLKKVGQRSIISSNINEIDEAEKLILPGVGAFDFGMEQLQNFNLIDVLNKKVLVDKTPILGICLGMQLFSQQSEEGLKPGLGWIEGITKKFNFDNHHNLAIPHMGWNTIHIEKESKLLLDLAQDSRFYFVHSYHMACKKSSDQLCSSEYGTKFTCAIEKDNILGVQFHPEKSHKFGMQILKNFAEQY